MVGRFVVQKRGEVPPGPNFQHALERLITQEDPLPLCCVVQVRIVPRGPRPRAPCMISSVHCHLVLPAAGVMSKHLEPSRNYQQASRSLEELTTIIQKPPQIDSKHIEPSRVDNHRRSGARPDPPPYRHPHTKPPPSPPPRFLTCLPNFISFTVGKGLGNGSSGSGTQCQQPKIRARISLECSILISEIQDSERHYPRPSCLCPSTGTSASPSPSTSICISVSFYAVASDPSCTSTRVSSTSASCTTSPSPPPALTSSTPKTIDACLGSLAFSLDRPVNAKDKACVANTHSLVNKTMRNLMASFGSKDNTARRLVLESPQLSALLAGLPRGKKLAEADGSSAKHALGIMNLLALLLEPADSLSPASPPTSSFAPSPTRPLALASFLSSSHSKGPKDLTTAVCQVPLTGPGPQPGGGGGGRMRSAFFHIFRIFFAFSGQVP